jgi:hypothetical protein
VKRVYEVRVERGACLDKWEYKVVSTSGQHAAKRALVQAVRDSGVKTGWRVARIQELDGYVIV